MITDKVLYSDGHTVMVTDTTLHVKSHVYNLGGIMKHGLHVIKPQRIPATLLLLVGIALVVSGVFQVFPMGARLNYNILGLHLSTSMLMTLLGSVSTVTSLMILTLVKEKYAVRIATAEGERDAIVSQHKEYITQILDAINRAYGFIHPRSKKNLHT